MQYRLAILGALSVTNLVVSAPAPAAESMEINSLVRRGEDASQPKCNADSCIKAITQGASAVLSGAVCAVGALATDGALAAIACSGGPASIAGNLTNPGVLNDVVNCVGCAYAGPCSPDDSTAEAHACGTGTDRDAKSKLVISPSACINRVGRGVAISGTAMSFSCRNKAIVVQQDSNFCQWPCQDCSGQMGQLKIDASKCN